MRVAGTDTRGRQVSKNGLESAAAALAAACDRLRFSTPVAYTYNPLSYAWQAHLAYILRYGHSTRRVLFLGMNPGPFGMVQTGVPFGDISAVRGWLGISAEVGQPRKCHPKRPVLGFACTRGEVSGQRLWGLFQQRFTNPEAFFREHFVANYCPLAFMEESGRNRTPDKLPSEEKAALFAACDTHLVAVVQVLRPEWVIGVGDFAKERATEALTGHHSVRIGRILHPSPACPAANRDWAGQVTRQLQDLGVWKKG